MEDERTEDSEETKEQQIVAFENLRILLRMTLLND